MTENIPGRKTFEAVLIPEGGTVTWVNEDVPELKAKVGDVTHMPFVYPRWKRKKDKTFPPSPSDAVVVDVDEEHRRHMTIGAITLYGREYEIVLKGTGLLTVKRGLVRRWKVDRHTFGSNDVEAYLRGLCGEREAMIDANVAQLVNRFGGHCAIPLSITAYNKIPYRRDKSGHLEYASVAELQAKGIIPSFVYETADGEESEIDKDAHVETLVAYSRAVETNVRIDDFRKKLVRAEVIRIVSSLSPGGEVTAQSLRGFFERSVRRMGTTLGVLHALGLVNGEMDARNTTLSGEITDLSACEAILSEGKMARELINLSSIAKSLAQQIGSSFDDLFVPSEVFYLYDNLHQVYLNEYYLAKRRTNVSNEEVDKLFY